MEKPTQEAWWDAYNNWSYKHSYDAEAHPQDAFKAGWENGIRHEGESSAVSFDWIAENTTGEVQRYAKACSVLIRDGIDGFMEWHDENPQ